jgi:hypothetical protein
MKRQVAQYFFKMALLRANADQQAQRRADFLWPVKKTDKVYRELAPNDHFCAFFWFVLFTTLVGLPGFMMQKAGDAPCQGKTEQFYAHPKEPFLQKSWLVHTKCFPPAPNFSFSLPSPRASPRRALQQP